MNARKKLIISITTLSVAIIATIGLVFGVLAARNQSVTSQFSATFVADNVSAKVGVKYNIGASGVDQFFTGGNASYASGVGSGSAISFNPASGETTSANATVLTMPLSSGLTSNIELTTENQYVMFTYYFKNTASTPDANQTVHYLAVNLTGDLFTSGNLDIYYYISPNDDETATDILASNNKFVGYSNMTQTTIYVEPQDTMYIYVIAKVHDLTTAVNVSSNNSAYFNLSTVDTLPQSWTNFTSSMRSEWGIAEPVLDASEYTKLSFTTQKNSTVSVSCANKSISGSVEIPSQVLIDGDAYSVTSIEYQGFSLCSAITSVIIPDSVTSIGYGAFSDCTSLTTVSMGSGVQTIGGGAFLGSGITSIIIPNGVTTIEEETFCYCSSLTTVSIGSGVQTIGNYAFSSSGLTSVTIPNSVTTIGNFAFYSCNSLASVSLGSGVQTIGGFAFSGCGMTTFLIPSNVTSVGAKALTTCSNLQEVVIESQEVYLSFNPTDTDSRWVGATVTIKVLSTADNGTNSYLNSGYTRTVSGNYNVYTPN